MTNKHYFYAVKLPVEVKQAIRDLIDIHKKDYPFKRWVHYQDYHITLAFLGFVPTELLASTISEMNTILRDEQSFSLTLHQFGTFGKKTHPRIFWLGVQPSEQLTQIQKKVYNQCIELGFKLDQKPFRPHITLARQWQKKEPFSLDKINRLPSEPNLNLTFPIKEIVLYQTNLNRVPKYKEFHQYHLKT